MVVVQTGCGEDDDQGRRCGCKNKHKAAGPPCPHCGKSEPGSCPKCVENKEETLVEEEPATVAPAQEHFIVTEEMVWQEDDL